jgi:hypothetical protein
MVFASRRTSIRDDQDIETILRDDHYRQTTPEDLLFGDLIVYRYAHNSRLIHVGMILRIEEIVPGGLRVPLVLSKWTDWAGEDEHRSTDVPATFGTPITQYWTDRPTVVNHA